MQVKRCHQQTRVRGDGAHKWILKNNGLKDHTKTVNVNSVP